MAKTLLFSPGMNFKCLKCLNENKGRPRIIRFGFFRRTSDGQRIQRFQCLGCLGSFSSATFNPRVRQKKRQKNEILRRLLAAGTSQRASARILNIHRTTVVRKFLFLSERARLNHEKKKGKWPLCQVVEFDDMETHEHTKYKPLSITLVVQSKTRRIIDLEVSRMAPKGLLAKRSYKKYGPRPDRRRAGRHALFKRLKPFIAENATMKSDENPHYPSDVKLFFPGALHEVHKGQRGSIVGQGELKKIRFDPLFSLNHTCAMNRANINRLFRRTWCTTKKAARLRAHLHLYIEAHNNRIDQVLRQKEILSGSPRPTQ